MEKNVYENPSACPKAWFVGSYLISKGREQSFNYLNSIDFDVHNKAILEEELNTKIEDPVNSMVNLTKYNPNNVWFTVEMNNNLFSSIGSLLSQRLASIY